MQVSVKSSLVCLLIGTLQGCAAFNGNSRLCADERGEFYTCNDLSIAPQLQTPVNTSLYAAPFHFQLLSEYTEQMAADLQKDLQGLKLKGKIAVASFVYLDATLQASNRLGTQLAEFFIHDLQAIGLPVSEHRLGDELVINAAGDFALSRNISNLKLVRDVNYVLVGTLVENDRGLILNARLVNTRSQRVHASASRFLPAAVISGL